jgi:predicted RNA-binding Zn-ribbon protein involved in translation (DUF1610 family)
MQKGWRVFVDVQLTEEEVAAIEAETGDTYEDRAIMSTEQFHFLASSFDEARMLAETYLDNSYETYTIQGIMVLQNQDGGDVMFITANDIFGDGIDCNCPVQRAARVKDENKMTIVCRKCGLDIVVPKENWIVLQCPKCQEVIYRDEVRSIPHEENTPKDEL